MENLTDRVLQYQRTREGLSEIVAELAPRVYPLLPTKKNGMGRGCLRGLLRFIHPRSSG